MKITKLALEKDIKRVFTQLGKAPTKIEYELYGAYGLNTIVRRYGSWNNALKEIFGYVNRSHGEPL